MEKFDSPLAPVPPFLDPDAEIHDPPAIHLKPYPFALFCVDGVVAAGAPLLRAFEVAAHFVSETGWGIAFRANNLGGVKATEGWAKAYRKRTGRSAPYFRAHGNRGTGDSETVVYRGYDTPADFFVEWLERFVPKPSPDAATREGIKVAIADYRLAGERFWSSGDWFAALLAAHYRGDVTASHPAQAIKDNASIAQDIREAWAQRALQIAVDGAWGKISRTCCAAFQSLRGLAVTGTPDDATITALARPVDVPPAPMP